MNAKGVLGLQEALQVAGTLMQAEQCQYELPAPSLPMLSMELLREVEESSQSQVSAHIFVHCIVTLPTSPAGYARLAFAQKKKKKKEGFWFITFEISLCLWGPPLANRA
jgi:hypothetical protein